MFNTEMPDIMARAHNAPGCRELGRLVYIKTCVHSAFRLNEQPEEKEDVMGSVRTWATACHLKTCIGCIAIRRHSRESAIHREWAHGSTAATTMRTLCQLGLATSWCAEHGMATRALHDCLRVAEHGSTVGVGASHRG